MVLYMSQIVTLFSPFQQTPTVSAGSRRHGPCGSVVRWRRRRRCRRLLRPQRPRALYVPLRSDETPAAAATVRHTHVLAGHLGPQPGQGELLLKALFEILETVCCITKIFRHTFLTHSLCTLSDLSRAAALRASPVPCLPRPLESPSGERQSINGTY